MVDSISTQVVNPAPTVEPEYCQIKVGDLTPCTFTVKDEMARDFIKLLEGAGWKLSMDGITLSATAPAGSNVVPFRRQS